VVIRLRRFFMAALLLGAIASPEIAHAAISFQSPIQLAVPGAADVRSADMDGDGKLDLVAVGTQGVSVLYGQADGPFGARLDFALGGGVGLQNHVQIALTDLNSDGQRDIVVPVLNLNKLIIIMSRGNRSYTPAINFPVGGNPESVVAGDFNRDGKPDLAFSNFSGPSLDILLNRGDGALLPPVSYSGLADVGGLASADFNGDGFIDIAMSTFYGGRGTLFLGDGTGKFSGTKYDTGGATPGRIVADDFDGDGKVDLASANYHGGSVSILFGDGRGAFNLPVIYGANMYPFVIAAADFDGDGDPDLIMVDSTLDYITLLENGEKGNFLPAVQLPSGGSFAQGLTTGDFNGDGRPDVAVANSNSNTVSVFLNDSPRPDPAILSVTVDPSDLIGGCQTASGTVIITSPAPAGGTVVSLTSTNASVAVLPRITIPQGAVSASFTPTISAASAVQTGTLTASVPGSGKRVVITIRPGGTAALHMMPDSLVGGAQSTGQVTFACPAGQEDLIVSLTSSQPGVVQVPAMVAVVPGALGASFSVTTRPVATDTPVVITAAFAGLTRSATLLVQPVPLPPPPPPLEAPSKLTAQAVVDGQVNLTWIDNSRSETGFAVFRREGAGAWQQIALLGPNITRFADLEVQVGRTYTYRVQAVSSTGVSEWSNEAAITVPLPPQVPAAPTNLTATAFSGTEIGLVWKDNSSNEDAFVVYRQEPGGDSVPIATLPANTVSYLDRGLRPGTTYRYVVRAWNLATGASKRSNEAIATTRTGP
jgi:hypothetical protein